MPSKKRAKRKQIKPLLAAPASRSLQELISEQGVKPIERLDSLSALWPKGDDPDAMMKFVNAERAARRAGMNVVCLK